MGRPAAAGTWPDLPVLIPAGPFWMGSDADPGPSSTASRPQHRSRQDMRQNAMAEQCSRCGQIFNHRPAYQFQTPRGLSRKCLRCALRDAPMLPRSGRIALIVGTILVAINHGDGLLAGHFPPAFAWKVPLTYAVPFIVATLGALGAGKVPGQPRGD